MEAELATQAVQNARHLSLVIAVAVGALGFFLIVGGGGGGMALFGGLLMLVGMWFNSEAMVDAIFGPTPQAVPELTLPSQMIFETLTSSHVVSAIGFALLAILVLGFLSAGTSYINDRHAGAVATPVTRHEPAQPQLSIEDRVRQADNAVLDAQYREEAAAKATEPVPYGTRKIYLEKPLQQGTGDKK